MVGRFSHYTDAGVYGPLIDGLIHRGWDVVRAVRIRPEGEDDIIHFRLAAEQNRVLVADDHHQLQFALAWIDKGEPFLATSSGSRSITITCVSGSFPSS